MMGNNVQQAIKLADHGTPIKLKVKLVDPGMRVSKNLEKKIENTWLKYKRNFSKAHKHESEVKRLIYKQNKYTGTYTKL